MANAQKGDVLFLLRNNDNYGILKEKDFGYQSSNHLTL
jgi:hypothetical protein